MTRSCFIIYSNDSVNHVKWVERLARKVRSAGIKVRMDRLDTHLGDDLVHFMTSMDEADRIILVCTPAFCRKDTGGAAFEKMLVSGELANSPSTNKFIPVLKEGNKASAIPKFLHTKKYISMLGTKIKDDDVTEIVKSIRRSYIGKRQQTIMKKKPATKKSGKMTTTAATDISDVSRIRLTGYTLLGGRGIDGIRYLWKTQEGAITESAAFNTRIKTSDISSQDKKISAYTTSVSFGCQLENIGKACCFCATGRLKYKGFLTAEEIALQNIFMAGYDADCPSWPEVRANSREFAFMGHGEPGLSYPQVRRSILLTDLAMDKLKQKVHRYIIASCGIADMLDPLAADLQQKVFKNRVTLHFSLHAVNKLRTKLMPINTLYPYERFLFKTKTIFDITGEKIAIGLLLFEKFSPNTAQRDSFSTESYLDKILDKLDPKIHRIDLCDVNMNAAISSQHEVSNEKARKLLARVNNRGFEAKLFSSFGTDKKSGCGMLASSTAKLQTPGGTTMYNFDKAIDVLRDVVKNVI